jgi:hypothetical protein
MNLLLFYPFPPLSVVLPLCLLPVLFLVLVATINGAGACAIASLAVVLIAFAMGAKDI